MGQDNRCSFICQLLTFTDGVIRGSGLSQRDGRRLRVWVNGSMFLSHAEEDPLYLKVVVWPLPVFSFSSFHILCRSVILVSPRPHFGFIDFLSMEPSSFTSTGP